MRPRFRSRATAIAAIAIASVLGVASGAFAAGPHRSSDRHHARGSVMISAASTCVGASAPVGTVPLAATKNAVVCLLNIERTSLRLRPLRDDMRLDRAAQGWTTTMVTDQLFSHGRDFGARISQSGFSFSSAGEDIAAGFDTPRSVVAAWMGSPLHCRNILDPNFVAVGTGVVSRAVGQFSGDAATWTEDFAAPRGARQSGDWGAADSRC